MMTLSDSIHNTEIIYLFVNRFDYIRNSYTKEENGGHPKTRKVYRAVRNTDTNTFRIIHKVDSKANQVHSVIIEDLQCDDESYGYTCDIREVTLNNILDFDMSEKCLDNLILWIDTDNKDVKDIIPVGPPTKPTPMNFVAQGKQAEIPEGGILINEELGAFIHMAAELHDSDPLMFGTVFDVLDHLSTQKYKPEIFETGWMGLDKQHGAGVNISSAIKKLSKYMSDDRRTNLDEVDLLGAISDLLSEQARRNYHEIE